MATIKVKSNVKRVTVFAPKEEGWSESVNINLSTPIEGYQFNEETGDKELTQVDAVSVFIGDVIKALCENASLAAFCAAKSKEDKVKLIPVLLAGADIQITREHIESEKKYVTTIEKITVSDLMLARIEKALDALLGF